MFCNPGRNRPAAGANPGVDHRQKDCPGWKIRRTATQRELIRAGQEIVELGYKSEDESQSLLDAAEARVYRLRPNIAGDTSPLAKVAEAWRSPNAAVANDKAAVESWGKLADALNEARREAAMSDADIAKRTHACADCGRDLVYSARGNRLPPAHDCPHGKRCYSRHGCGECRKGRAILA